MQMVAATEKVSQCWEAAELVQYWLSVLGTRQDPQTNTHKQFVPPCDSYRITVTLFHFDFAGLKSLNSALEPTSVSTFHSFYPGT